MYFSNQEELRPELRPKLPERPERTPVTLPVREEVRVVTFPNPAGFVRPTPDAPPRVEEEKSVVRGVAE